MDGAEASYLYSAPKQSFGSRRAWGSCRRAAVKLCGTVPSADLGGSSKYSREELED